MHALDVLSAVHALLRPDGYLEIGPEDGAALGLASAATIALDPGAAVAIDAALVGAKPWFQLRREPSDAFFARADREAALLGRRLDLTVISRAEPPGRVLRDLGHAERWSHPAGVVAIRGIDPDPTLPDPGDGSAGNGADLVNRLRRLRPDLVLLPIPRTEAGPDGLLILVGLDPENDVLLRGEPSGDDAAEPAPHGQGEIDAPPWVSTDEALRLVAALAAGRGPTAGADPAAAAIPTVPSMARQVGSERPGRGRAEPHAEPVAACEAVLAAPAAKPEDRDEAMRRLALATPRLASLVGRCELHRVELDLPPGWFATNPSIAADDDGYLAIVRVLDYEIVGPYEYRLHGPGGTQNSVNHAVRFDRDLRQVAAFPIVDATRRDPRHPCRYSGLEDCRLVRWREQWVASCGTVDRTPSCVGKIDLARFDPGAGAFHDLAPLSDRAADRWEKNWMPVVDGDELLFVYGLDPVVVLRFDPERQTLGSFRRHAAPPLLRDAKGGSPGLRVAGGWLFCVHQSADFVDRNRCYLHRFLLLDEEFRPTRLSGPFTFLHAGVEFCAGLARHGDDLVASFGVEDREAHLAQLSLSEVLGMLRPLDDGTRPRVALAGIDDGGLAVERVLRIEPGVWHVQGRADRSWVGASPRVVAPGSGGGAASDVVWRSTPGSTEVAFGARFAFTGRAPTEPNGARIAFATAGGGVTAAPLPGPIDDDREVLEALKEEIDPDRPRASWERMAALHRSLAPVHRRIVESAAVAHAETLGTLPKAPRATVVVPLHRNLSFLERQVATFAADPDFAEIETILLLDGPEMADAFLALARGLVARHGLPVLALVTNHNAGFSAANNLAVARARAPFVVLQNSDAFPAAPGWVGRMTAAFAGDPAVGAVQPKLLYPDGRVQGTGNDYVRLPDLPGWNWRTRHWSVPRDDPAVAADAPVRGAAAASMAVPTDLYRRVGGLPDCYLTGQFEDCEFNDRIRAQGYQPWYLASVEVIHLEAGSYEGAARRREWLYNAWLYARRQGAFLAAER